MTSQYYPKVPGGVSAVAVATVRSATVGDSYRRELIVRWAAMVIDDDEYSH